VKQDPETGALRFVPVRVQRAEAVQETVSFSPSAITQLVGNFTAGPGLEVMVRGAGAEEDDGEL
jgi:hypothetical protein